MLLIYQAGLWRSAWALARRRKAEALIRGAFLILLIAVFHEIYRATPLSTYSQDLTANELTWYFCCVEIIILSTPLVATAMEQDCHTGRMVHYLLWPSSYLFMRIAKATTEFFIRWLIVMMIGCGTVWALAGPPDVEPATFGWTLLLMFFGGWTCTIWQVAIGISTVWLTETRPIGWFWQRCTFLFGGLFLPIALYPEPFRVICEWTPFGAAVSIPASMIVPALTTPGPISLVFWMISGVITCCALWAAARRHLPNVSFFT